MFGVRSGGHAELNASENTAQREGEPCTELTSPKTSNVFGSTEIADSRDLRASQPVPPRGLKTPPSLTPVTDGEEIPLTGLSALKGTPLVTIPRRPSTFHAKAYLRTEETRNLSIPFGKFSSFRTGGTSGYDSVTPPDECSGPFRRRPLRFSTSG